MITGTNFEMTSSVSNLTLGETEDCTPGLNCSLSGWTKFDVIDPSGFLYKGSHANVLGGASHHGRPQGRARGRPCPLPPGLWPPAKIVCFSTFLRMESFALP